MLDIIDLHKSFGSLEILKGVSLSASKGINFLETPTSGTITLDNYSISSTNPQKPSKKQILELRTQTAMVFQQFNLWSHMTVLKNIGITLGWSLRNQIRSNARCYNLYHQQQLSNIL